MDLLDINRPETWRNNPAPRLDSSAQEELTRLFGLNPHGEPMARLVFGQERRWWDMGDPNALLYVDLRIPPQIHERHSLRRCTFIETIAQPDGTVREVPHYEIQYLDDTPEIIPPGYFYACESEMEWIGEQLWYLEMWRPPDEIPGGEYCWNRDRFGPGENRLTGIFDPLLDWLGPWPGNRGEYVSKVVIGEPYLYPVYEDVPTYEIYHAGTDKERIEQTGFEKVKRVFRHMRYQEPSRAFFDELRKVAWERRNLKPSERATTFQERKDSYRRREEARIAANRAYARRAMRSESWRFTSIDKGGVRGGNARSAPTIDPSNAKSRHGRGTKVVLTDA